MEKGWGMEQFCKTIWWYLILIFIWQGIEIVLYGEIQNRTVDDIMSLLYLPFIWMAMK